MPGKQVLEKFTQAFRLEPVRKMRAGHAESVVAKVLGIPKTSLGNWVHLDAKGELGEVAGNDKAYKITAEQMEIARLPAEPARLRVERDIAKK